MFSRPLSCSIPTENGIHENIPLNVGYFHGGPGGDRTHDSLLNDDPASLLASSEENRPLDYIFTITGAPRVVSEAPPPGQGCLLIASTIRIVTSTHSNEVPNVSQGFPAYSDVHVSHSSSAKRLLSFKAVALPLSYEPIPTES